MQNYKASNGNAVAAVQKKYTLCRKNLFENSKA
jgi:hypothetical protein